MFCIPGNVTMVAQFLDEATSYFVSFGVKPLLKKEGALNNDASL